MLFERNETSTDTHSKLLKNEMKMRAQLSDILMTITNSDDENKTAKKYASNAQISHYLVDQCDDCTRIFISIASFRSIASLHIFDEAKFYIYDN